MSNSPPPNGSDILDGWKNIAEYLGKSVRTAQRWRQEFGMPVHRLGGREGENVYAFRTELDSWRRQASGLNGFTAASAEPEERAEPAARTGGSPRAPATVRARLLWGAASALLLLAAAGFLARNLVDWTRPPRSHPAPGRSVSDPRPARWIVIGNEFRFYNSAGEALWSYVPGPDLEHGPYVGHRDPDNIPLADEWEVGAGATQPVVKFVDIDGDNSTEVLLVAHGRGLSNPSVVHCVDQSGRQRWTFTPGDTMVFGGESFGTPVNVPFLSVAPDDGGGASIWFPAEHRTWFPTLVYRLGPSGEVVARYGSNGRLTRIRFAEAGGRRLVLLAGVNNERRMASLAVFETARFGGAAPAETAKYRCDNCGPGGPDHYLLFPPTDLSALVGAMPSIGEIAALRSGEFVVSVRQHAVVLPGDDTPSQALTNYRIDPQLRAFGAEFFDQFATVHDHYAAAGRLNHRFDAAREQAQLWPVLRWNGSAYDRIEGPERK
ncbi:MAG TPA: helix-turn-helix domain-containing protein [Vicinamibacterales bacterium]|nr:helix-turn-helix domain-containing protein [Vicinamibacterales bacterium]